MITIKGFPLLHEDECDTMFSADQSWAGEFFIKPKYKWLPDSREDEEREGYLLKDIKPGMYLVGLEVISDRWLNKGFCAMLLNHYGLVLDESYPMARMDNYKHEKTYVHYSFEHITDHSHNPLEVSLD